MSGMKGKDFIKLLDNQELINIVSNIGGSVGPVMIKLMSGAYEAIDETDFEEIMTGILESYAVSNPSQRYDDLVNAFEASSPDDDFNNNPGRSIVTVAAAANGFQISEEKNSNVNYSVTITTTVQIGVATNVEGYIVLEIAPTNSSTAGDWIEIGRITAAQSIGLALALSSAQKVGGQIGGMVPAGYYARLRSVNVSGSPSYAINSGQEFVL